MTDYIEREIHFFRIDAGFDTAGKPVLFDPTPILRHVDKLGWKDEQDNNRYWDRDGKIIGCWVSDINKPCKVILGSIRRTDFPLIEILGERSPLELPEKAGLVEQTHIVFLAPDIVGCDSNFYGPRVTRLASYLSEKAVGIAPEVLMFHPVVRRDVYQQLKGMKFLKSIDMKVRPSYEDAIADIDVSLDAAIKTALKAGGYNDINVELILQASQTSNGWLPEKWLENLKAMFKNKKSNLELEKLSITGYNAAKQRDEKLNLLSDKLVIKRSILKADYKSNALNSRAAFDAIIDAYNEVKDELAQSPTALI